METDSCWESSRKDDRKAKKGPSFSYGRGGKDPEASTYIFGCTPGAFSLECISHKTAMRPHRQKQETNSIHKDPEMEGCNESHLQKGEVGLPNDIKIGMGRDKLKTNRHGCYHPQL